MLNESSRLDLAFQALSDPTRRGMLARLSRAPASVSELAGPLRMSLPAVMQHLRLLEASGLVRSQKKGRVRTCRLEPKALTYAEGWIAEQRAAWEAQLDRFEDHVLRMKREEEGG
jgi:DNA-binding transcriptional ArsR family regulator